jgi:hypothetical protein
VENETDHDFYIYLQLVDADNIHKTLKTVSLGLLQYHIDKEKEPGTEFTIVKEIFDTWVELYKECTSQKRNFVLLIEKFMIHHINLLERDENKISALTGMIK